MTAGEAMERLRSGEGNPLFLDLNEPKGAVPYEERFPGRWKNIPYEHLASRLEELPGDRMIITVCDSGVRSYESQVFLSARGFSDVWAMEGGLNLLRRTGEDPLPREPSHTLP
jgi:rhodanese-related sulfurtransferase